ncbi:MAG: N-acetylmuramoyl-L-alanine amidase [Spirulinaceae cyanobacterium]
MRLRWLALTILSILIYCTPAEAGRLLRANFNAQTRQLNFITNEGVQPTAKLISNPTRLIIDLPGTSLGGTTKNENLSGAIRSWRVGQFNDQTTRIVIELAPGYTMDPEQIKIRGASPTQWSAELPTPQREQASTTPPPTTNNPNPPDNLPPNPPPSDNGTAGWQIYNFQETENGFFLRARGNERPKRPRIQRSRDQRRIDIEMEGATLDARLKDQTLNVGRFGVNQILFTQENNQVRLTLNVDKDAPDWIAAYSDLGGVVLVPRSVSLSESEPVATLEIPTSAIEVILPQNIPTQIAETPTATKLTTVQGLEFNLSNTQLLILADGPVEASSGWNSSAGVYEITIPNAQVSPQPKAPQLGANSPIARIRLRNKDEKTVVILIQPTSNTQIGELNQLSEQVLALELRSAPIRPPSNTPNNTQPQTPLPTVPQGTALVAVDPGHGGKDPGAIGISGLREKDVILPIAREIAQYLEQQGVRTLMTRSDDTFISLQGRTDLANRAGADLFVSVHANAISLDRPDINGLETYYYSSGQQLAQTIHRSVLQNVDIADRGVRTARFYVLRNSAMPSVLVEVGFVTGGVDAANLSNPNFRSQMAQAIARGVLEYIQQYRL